MIATALDAILGLIVLEGIVLGLVRVRTGRGVPFKPLVCNLAAGFFLLLTARLVLEPHVPLGLPAASLLAALVAHAADLAGRWH